MFFVRLLRLCFVHCSTGGFSPLCPPSSFPLLTLSRSIYLPLFGTRILCLFLFPYGGFRRGKVTCACHTVVYHTWLLCFATRLQRTVASLYYRRRVIYAYPEFFVTVARDRHLRSQFALLATLRATLAKRPILCDRFDK